MARDVAEASRLRWKVVRRQARRPPYDGEGPVVEIRSEFPSFWENGGGVPCSRDGSGQVGHECCDTTVELRQIQRFADGVELQSTVTTET